MEKLIFIDTETTGLGTEDRVCQVAYMVPGEEIVVENFKPPVPIGIGAMAISHITNEMVEDCEPFEGSDMKKALIKFSDDGYIPVIHSAPFDLKLLLKEGVTFPHWIDTLEIARNTLESSKNNLQYLRYFLKLDLPDIVPHSADGDVKVLVAIYEKLFEQAGSVEEMIRLSRKKKK